jgi:hypothetical protein
MRAGLGLVAILIAVFIMVYMFAHYTDSSRPGMNKATFQANQMAGNSTNGVGIGQRGTPVMQDSKFQEVERNGKLIAVKVTVLPPTNGLAEFYGLLVNDEIVQVGQGGTRVGQDHLSDYDSVRDFILDAYQKQQLIVVKRNGVELTLPRDRDIIPPVPAPGNGNTGGGGDTTGAGKTGDTVGSVEKDAKGSANDLVKKLQEQGQ